MNDSYAAQILRENLPSKLKESIGLVPKPDPQKIIKQLGKVDSAYANANKTLNEKQAEFDRLKIGLTGKIDSKMEPLLGNSILNTSTINDIARLKQLDTEMNNIKDQMAKNIFAFKQT